MARLKRTTTRNTVTGALRDRLHFQKRGTADDGFGNQVPGGEFATEFTVYANLRPLLRGSSSGIETVFAHQIQGNQPYTITIKKHPKAKDVTVAWRIVDSRDSNIVYNIITPPTDPNNSDMWVELVAVKGRPS